ncbi:MAG: hypothetical protein E7773_01860 [Sphingomonas sp.]|uniref:hypothetical protein n=1 Tax=Sphingomonas sp. TaxID=28214 RepID=UPI00121E0155|nr:hypothetical protein [Sphingomonas sp.]THD37751.1 MAG: hypothetical protein E7773_01860 [Sphingomonas sp.]
MPKPLNRTQAIQNQQFLRELRRTGNVRLSARAVGLKYSTIQHRRRQHPAFATRWDAAIAFAQARLNKKGRQGPKPKEGGNRTLGGEPVIVRRNDGKLQMRAAQPGKLTKQCEQAFLSALSATANVRLSAKAAGAAEAAFYRRRRQNPAFAREWLLALQEGYDRLEMALHASVSPASHEDDAWRSNAPPDMPPMTVNQALQLMYLHQKEARLQAEPAHIRRRKGESREAHSFRLSAMYEARLQRDRERFEVMEAARRERGEGPYWGPRIELPDLGQVKGWSKADPAKTPHDPDRALFGGWRIGNIKSRGKE